MPKTVTLLAPRMPRQCRYSLPSVYSDLRILKTLCPGIRVDADVAPPSTVSRRVPEPKPEVASTVTPGFEVELRAAGQAERTHVVAPGAHPERAAGGSGRRERALEHRGVVAAFTCPPEAGEQKGIRRRRRGRARRGRRGRVRRWGRRGPVAAHRQRADVLALRAVGIGPLSRVQESAKLPGELPAAQLNCAAVPTYPVQRQPSGVPATSKLRLSAPKSQETVKVPPGATVAGVISPPPKWSVLQLRWMSSTPVCGRPGSGRRHSRRAPAGVARVAPGCFESRWMAFRSPGFAVLPRRSSIRAG